MKTFNTFYQSPQDLINFIDNHLDNKQEKFLVQLFVGIPDREFIKELIKIVKDILPNSSIIGSTTDGEITDAKVTTFQTTVSITRFDHVTFKTGFVEYDDHNDIKESAKILAGNILKDDTKCIISFADGLNTNGEQFLKAISKINNNVVVSGGLAGDNSTFKGTYVFIDEKILSKGAVAVSLNGELNLYTDYNFNWEPIGKELTITKAKDNVVYTIDDKTAYETYKYYLGDEVAKKLPAIGIEFPLIIKRDGIQIARALLGLNDDKSLVFAGDLKVGDRVQFGYGNSEMILNNSHQSAAALNDVPVESIFIYSCMARRRFMPKLIENEIKPLSMYGSVAGFFTYGEFFTQQRTKKQLLNQTMTILALSESDKKQSRDIKSFVNSNSQNTNTLKALSHLVNVTSNELYNINEDLKVSIKREQEIISQQEKHIYTQAKMAAMGDMIGNIAHQWRQPLSNISTAITAVKIQHDLGILDDKFFEETTDKIVNNVDHLAETIKIFRDFLKDDKELKVQILQDTLKNVMEIVTPSLADNHIKLIRDIDEEGEFKLKMISDELSQVLINIINNAKDAILENGIQNGFVKLICYKEDSTISIKVQDNGGGIQQSVINRIFDPYFTTKDESTGTGLGLHMSYDIITKHLNGKIDVSNEDDGACFNISLPAYEEEKEEK